MSSSSITFNGSSTYATSFQSVLQRAVGIASLPLTQMQNNLNDFQQQSVALSSLQATFGSLQNSINNVGAATGGSVSASSSDQSVVAASAQTGTLPGTYSVVVVDVGSSTSTLSNAGATPVTDVTTANISSSLNYTLTVNGAAHTINLTSNSLQELAKSINSAGLGVQATMVNMGSTASPDYRLSVTSSNLGTDTIQLNDGTTDLLNQLQAGTPAQYKVGGSSTVINSNTNKVTLAPGLTATLLKSAPGETVNVTVAATQNALTSALSSFATAYNSAVSALAKHRGQAGGALTGQSVIFTLSDALHQITQYQSKSSGNLGALSDVGLTLDSTGAMSFDATKINEADTSAVQSFLGSTKTTGFLATAFGAIDGVANATEGMITHQITSISGQITAVNVRYTSTQSRIDDLQANLTKQLTAADSAIAVLEGQKSYYKDLFNQIFNKSNNN